MLPTIWTQRDRWTHVHPTDNVSEDPIDATGPWEVFRTAGQEWNYHQWRSEGVAFVFVNSLCLLSVVELKLSFFLQELKDRYEQICEEALSNAQKETQFYYKHWLDSPWSGFFEGKDPLKVSPTGVKEETLAHIGRKFSSPPENAADFSIHRGNVLFFVVWVDFTRCLPWDVVAPSYIDTDTATSPNRFSVLCMTWVFYCCQTSKVNLYDTSFMKYVLGE